MSCYVSFTPTTLADNTANQAVNFHYDTDSPAPHTWTYKLTGGSGLTITGATYNGTNINSYSSTFPYTLVGNNLTVTYSGGNISTSGLALFRVLVSTTQANPQTAQMVADGTTCTPQGAFQLRTTTLPPTDAYLSAHQAVVPATAADTMMLAAKNEVTANIAPIMFLVGVVLGIVLMIHWFRRQADHMNHVTNGAKARHWRRSGNGHTLN